MWQTKRFRPVSLCILCTETQGNHCHYYKFQWVSSPARTDGPKAQALKAHMLGYIHQPELAESHLQEMGTSWNILLYQIYSDLPGTCSDSFWHLTPMRVISYTSRSKPDWHHSTCEVCEHQYICDDLWDILSSLHSCWLKPPCHCQCKWPPLSSPHPSIQLSSTLASGIFTWLCLKISPNGTRYTLNLLHLIAIFIYSYSIYSHKKTCFSLLFCIHLYPINILLGIVDGNPGSSKLRTLCTSRNKASPLRVSTSLPWPTRVHSMPQEMRNIAQWHSGWIMMDYDGWS